MVLHATGNPLARFHAPILEAGAFRRADGGIPCSFAMLQTYLVVAAAGSSYSSLSHTHDRDRECDDDKNNAHVCLRIRAARLRLFLSCSAIRKLVK